MKHFTLTALLVLVIVYLWRRLQDETARADANADKAHQYDAEGMALERMNVPDVVNPRSDQALRDAATEYGLHPITWTDEDEEGA